MLHFLHILCVILTFWCFHLSVISCFALHVGDICHLMLSLAHLALSCVELTSTFPMTDIINLDVK